VGDGDGDGLVVGLGLGEGLVVGDGDGDGLGLGLGAGSQSMTVPVVETVPRKPSDDSHTTSAVTTSPFWAEMGNTRTWEGPVHDMEWTPPPVSAPPMVTVAECVPVSGKKSNMTLTSLQWILTETWWASAAVAAPRTRPAVISITAAIFVFGLMSPPFHVVDVADEQRPPIRHRW
jgi:hypothetical protein